MDDIFLGCSSPKDENIHLVSLLQIFGHPNKILDWQTNSNIILFTNIRVCPNTLYSNAGFSFYTSRSMCRKTSPSCRNFDPFYDVSCTQRAQHAPFSEHDTVRGIALIWCRMFCKCGAAAPVKISSALNIHFSKTWGGFDTRCSSLFIRPVRIIAGY